jgi:hypothetical protein
VNVEYQESYYEEPIEPGDEPIESSAFEIEATEKASTTMFGFEAGLRAVVVRWFALEGGWRYRNWTYDRSPGTYDGPYIRCAFSW